MHNIVFEPIAIDQLFVRNSDMRLVRILSIDSVAKTVDFQNVKGERHRSTASLDRFTLAYSRYYRRDER